MPQYRLTVAIYTLAYIQNPLIDMDTSITRAFTQYTSERASYVHDSLGTSSDKFTFEHQASNIFLHFLITDYPFKPIYY